MLRKLRISNFKSWKDTRDIQLASIGAFFGTNSSGKSSLLQLLLLLKQTAESPDRAQALNLGGEREYVQLGRFGDILHAHEYGVQMKMDLEWNLPDQHRVENPTRRGRALFSDDEMGFSSAISGHESGKFEVEKFIYRFASRRFGMRREREGRGDYKLFSEALDAGADSYKFVRTPGRAWPLPSPMKCYGFPDQAKAYFQNAGFLSGFELELEKLMSRLFYLGPLREYPQRQYAWAGTQPADMGQRGERVVDALLASREWSHDHYISRGRGAKRFTVEEQVAWWLRELDLIHDFKVEQVAKDSNLYRVRVQKSRGSAPVLITDVGFGVSQILPVIALCYYVPKGSIVLLEQPEIHLHPSVQAGLADVFVDATKRRDVQIIVESHSEHLLRRLQRNIAEEKLRPEEAALYFCDVDKGVSRIRRLETDIFGQIANWPENFFGDEFGEMAAITKAAMERQSRGSV